MNALQGVTHLHAAPSGVMAHDLRQPRRHIELVASAEPFRQPFVHAAQGQRIALLAGAQRTFGPDARRQVGIGRNHRVGPACAGVKQRLRRDGEPARLAGRVFGTDDHIAQRLAVGEGAHHRMQRGRQDTALLVAQPRIRPSAAQDLHERPRASRPPVPHDCG
jgi:hypothetical protein